MVLRKEHRVNHSKWFVSKCRQAINNYRMIEPGEPVCVALSGGKDSAVLLFILWYLNQYGGLRFPLLAAHIKTAGYDTGVLRALCQELAVEYLEGCLTEPVAAGTVCSLCARLKRGALRSLVTGAGVRKLAYGHHADDAAETFFLNVVHGRKLGSFAPKVGIADSPLVIIRPMIYLREKTITSVHRYVGLPLLDHVCPQSQIGERKRIKELLTGLAATGLGADFVDSLIASLENLDRDGLWANWLEQKNG